MRLSVWKDRPGRTRIIALYDGKHEDARRYFYRQYHPNEDIKGYRILQLDMNPWNFDEDNLVKITPRIMNCLLNNNLLSNNVELNKMAIQTLELEFMCREVLKNGDVNG